MGTTVTPNLNLIKPDGSEPGSNFPAQHASNMDTLDTKSDDLEDRASPGLNRDESSTDITGITTTTYAAGSPVVGTTFVAPKSGAVEVVISGKGQVVLTAAGFRSLFFGMEVREGGTIGSGAVVKAAAEDDSLEVGTGSNSSGDRITAGSSMVVPVTGLTPGNTYNVRSMHKVSVGTSLTADIYFRRIHVRKA